MNESEQTTMVANFDSMEQLKQWMRIAGKLEISANGLPDVVGSAGVANAGKTNTDATNAGIISPIGQSLKENQSIEVSSRSQESGETGIDGNFPQSQQRSESPQVQALSQPQRPGENVKTQVPPQPHSLTTGLWAQSDFENNCENLLNTYPEFASCFAGIIRTAYLYAPKIVVTVADLFDGVFFVVLGPKAVNGILGTSYKDGAKLVVSGVKDTFAESLVSFIAGGKKNDETGKLENIGTSEKTYCTLNGRLIGLPGLKRASLGWGTHLYARALDSDESRLTDLVQSQGEVRASSKSIAQALVHALVRTLRKQESFTPDQSGVSEQEWDELSSGTTQALSCFEFLARRWQEWLEAERHGEIVYRKQEGPAFWKEFARVIESEPVQTAAKGFVYDEDSYEAVGQRVFGLVENSKDDQKVTDTIASYESADRRAAAARFVVETNMCRRSDALPLVVMVILSWMISAIPSFINLYRWGKEVKSSGETVLIDG
ncbi:hypothetical protein [Bifidobacterium sp. ESL0745]|uniref:hypothetical protein n=1 Tax=Bifidobacterium sp. ESL0745 TaxID=2983226 RepID=UPI0023F7C57E|nr:hypothetical protein [Bifidobacterium sp. ESL0745]MDF7665580.1 hypothetical protein [Bifidobacterium sp. ESL0745]